MARKKKTAPVVQETPEVINNEKEVTSEISGITLTLEPEPFDAAEFYRSREENTQTEQDAPAEEQPPVADTENSEPVIHEYPNEAPQFEEVQMPEEDQPVIIEEQYDEPVIHEYPYDERKPETESFAETEPELTAQGIVDDIMNSDMPEEEHQFIENAETQPERAEEIISEQPQSEQAGDETPVKTKDFDAEAIREEEKQEKSMTKHVELKQVKRKKKKNAEMKLGFNWFFWISFIIILIPCVYFVMLLLDASDKTNTPLVGERPEYDLRYVIEDSQLDEVKTAVSGIEGIEKVYVNLAVETLRVTIDTGDELTPEQVKAIAEQAYEKVNEVLPVETYFTLYQTYKQYDMQIDVYNNVEFDKEKFIYYSLWRNSNMENYSIKDMNAALNPELYNELLEEIAEEKRQEEEAKNQQNAENGEEGGNAEESGN